MFTILSERHAAFAALLCTLVFPFVFSQAHAQASVEQCSAVLEKISSRLVAKDSKQIVLLERQNLTWCRGFFDGDTYEQHLDTLASALIDERQFAEATGVANQCLKSNSENLSCLADKAEALLRSNKVELSKATAEKAAHLGAVSQFDALAKKKIAALLEEIRVNEKTATAAVSTMLPKGVVPLGVTGEIACASMGNVGLSITINGEITAKAAQEVEKLFTAFHAAEQGDKSACTRTSSGEDDLSASGTHFGINSNGGDVTAAMTIGRRFRKENAWLGVDGRCISSCVLILAGAVERQVSRDNVVGIHRPYLVNYSGAASANIAATYSSYLEQIKSYFREMNVSPRLATDMLAVEPESVRMLSLKELQSYRLSGVDPNEQERRALSREIHDLKEAEELGIDRIEYTKRKARANAACSAATEYFDCYSRAMKTRVN